MCQAKPGTRCAGDSEKDLTRAKDAYLAALAAHAENLDDPDTGIHLQQAAQDMWTSQLEYAAAVTKAPRPVTDDWRTNIGFNLAQTHRDQAALMPAAPGKDAPKTVRDAHAHLAACRDRLARADAIIATDEQSALSGKAQPGPVIGPRPAQWTVEQDVTNAEYDYARALHPTFDMTAGESWRHLLNQGQMPYNPFNHAHHPTVSQTAPWVRHSRSAGAVDVPALRRASGLGDSVYWDSDTQTISVRIDEEEYMDNAERDDYTAGVEAAMWQLGYHTERHDSEIVVSKVPDIAGWVAATRRAERSSTPARKVA